MKKGIVVALVGIFAVFAVGVASATINADGTMTINKDAKVFPAGKLNADGTKKKGPVTFNHTKHGAAGCQVCHHTEKELKAGATAAKSCFECHGPAADGKKVDSYEMIHKAKCIPCHKTDAAAMAAKAPTSCKACHGGAE